jgi:hypothetical protein
MTLQKFVIFLFLVATNTNVAQTSMPEITSKDYSTLDDNIFNQIINGIRQPTLIMPAFDFIFPFMAQAIKSSKSDKIDIIDDLIHWCQLEPNALHRDLFLFEILNQVTQATQNQKNLTIEDYQIISNNILTSLKNFASQVAPVSNKQKGTKKAKLIRRIILLTLLFLTVTITVSLAAKLYNLAKAYEISNAEQEKLKVQYQNLSEGLDEQKKEVLAALISQRTDIGKTIADLENKQDECAKMLHSVSQDAKIAQDERSEIMRKQTVLMNGIKAFSEAYQVKTQAIIDLVAQRQGARTPTTASRVVSFLDHFSGFDSPLKTAQTVSDTVDKISATAKSLVGTKNATEEIDKSLRERLDRLKHPESVPVSASTSLSLASLLPAVPH